MIYSVKQNFSVFPCREKLSVLTQEAEPSFRFTEDKEPIGWASAKWRRQNRLLVSLNGSAFQAEFLKFSERLNLCEKKHLLVHPAKPQ